MDNDQKAWHIEYNQEKIYLLLESDLQDYTILEQHIHNFIILLKTKKIHKTKYFFIQMCPFKICYFTLILLNYNIFHT
mgnify:CR=1 FL=1